MSTAAAFFGIRLIIIWELLFIVVIESPWLILPLNSDVSRRESRAAQNKRGIQQYYLDLGTLIQQTGLEFGGPMTITFSISSISVVAMNCTTQKCRSYWNMKWQTVAFHLNMINWSYCRKKNNTYAKNNGSDSIAPCIDRKEDDLSDREFPVEMQSLGPCAKRWDQIQVRQVFVCLKLRLPVQQWHGHKQYLPGCVRCLKVLDGLDARIHLILLYFVCYCVRLLQLGRLE